jgi:PcfJ-like protein
VRSESLLREAAKRRLDICIHESRRAASARPDVLAAYERLRSHVVSQSDLLARRTRCGQPVDIDKALLAMALHHRDWIAPPEDWRPSPAPIWPTLASLAEHLFARYPMPRFTTSVWLHGKRGERVPQHQWYKRLGAGESLRDLALPMHVTKRVAHLFRQAPDHLTVIAALRWSQVHALGGDELLARAVLATRLGRRLENESFWETAIQFFVRHPDLEPAQVGPIVDFLQHRKFECREGVDADGMFGPQPPPDPDFTLKGRTPASLLRLVEAWHEELGTKAVAERRWPRSRLGEFRFIEKVAASSTEREPQLEARVWTISELCSSTELLLEGRVMRHCVATYVVPCLQRRTSIWSMQLETRLGQRRVVTVEVDPATRLIRQVRRKCNRLPSEAELQILGMWAQRERLTFAPSERIAYAR